MDNNSMQHLDPGSPPRGGGKFVTMFAGLLSMLSLVGLVLIAGCSGGGGANDPAPDSVSFLITNASGQPVVGATVYLVPAADVDGSPITGQDVLDGNAEVRDEPLEDAIAAFGSTYAQGVTGPDGRVEIGGVPLGRYFWFVSPNDGEHLPGGTDCRRSREASQFLGLTMQVQVTSAPTPTATHVGTTTCISCHPDYATQANHAHRLGFTVPGQQGGLQDFSRYPDFSQGFDAFLPASSFAGGTVVYFYDFDPSRGFDKFKTSLTDPGGGGGADAAEGTTSITQVKAYLWRDNADSKYKITLENVINGADILSPWTLEVPLVYGGAIYKQRNLVKVPGRLGLFPFLQIQTEGDEARWDRTRKQYRDYHLDWFWDATNNLLKEPPLNKNFEANCTACHSTGWSAYQDMPSGTWLSTAVSDPNGVYDIDGDGLDDEINLGCEVCHGPGSDHVAWASNPANAGMEGRFVVQPEMLSPSREMLMCGRCHDRAKGNGTIINDQTVNSQNQFAPIGIKRSDYLAQYTSRKGPGTGDFWDDGIHSKSHHQQYSDLLKSTMHRNGRIITVCSDCHDSHGYAPFRRHLTEDPDDPNGPLCAQCHPNDLFSHIQVQTGFLHAGNQTTCVRCHQPRTAKTGSGVYGLLIGQPTGTVADEDLIYHQNDIGSHLFLNVPRKTHPGTAGETPIDAMPVPYTNSCGSACHQPGNIPFISPAMPAAPGVTTSGTVEAHEPDDGN